jgi:hypothetical protein
MNDADKRALPLPAAIAQATELAPEAHELIRAWWDGERTRMMIRTTFDDPSRVGILLADLSWHFANGYANRLGLDREAVLADIRERWTQHQKWFDESGVDLAAGDTEGASRS